jgi:hypothetical protein
MDAVVVGGERLINLFLYRRDTGAPPTYLADWLCMSGAGFGKQVRLHALGHKKGISNGRVGQAAGCNHRIQMVGSSPT